MKKIWLPQIIASLMLLWALNPSNPYGYYILLRYVCFTVFLYLTYLAYENDKFNWIWIMGISTLIYNPIIRIHLNREIWSIINVISIVIVLTSIFIFKPIHTEEKIEIDD